MANLFKPPSPPQVAVAPPMPDANSPSVLEAQNQAAAAAMARAGRASTIIGAQSKNAPSQAPVAQDAYAATRLGASQ
jgi:hypothetical protein